jgi:AcrR family transcriptional regulator
MLRQQAILAATMACIQRTGMAAMTVEDICAEAGISKGAFYKHFPSKTALLHALIGLRASELVAASGTTVQDFADGVFDGQIAPTLTRANGRFGLEVMVAGEDDPFLRAKVLADLEALRTSVEMGVRGLAASGAIALPGDPGQLSRIIERYVLGVVTREALKADMTHDAVRADVRALFATLLRPKP